MSATKRVKWYCPNGCPAVLASTRPRRDDVARYCLACSEKRGRLVLRTAPAIVKKREAKVAAAQAQKAARAERAAERATAYHTIHGVDLREELKKLWALPIARELRAKLHPQHRVTPPKLVVRTRSTPHHRYGVAYCHRHEILMNRIPGHDAFVVRDTLAHEVAHILTPGARHGIPWKTAFRLLCEQAYGVRPRVENRFTDADKLMRVAADPPPPTHKPDCASYDFDPDKQLGPDKACDCGFVKKLQRSATYGKTCRACGVPMGDVCTEANCPSNTTRTEGATT